MFMEKKYGLRKKKQKLNRLSNWTSDENKTFAVFRDDVETILVEISGIDAIA